MWHLATNKTFEIEPAGDKCFQGGSLDLWISSLSTLWIWCLQTAKHNSFSHSFPCVVLVRLAGWWAARRIWGLINHLGASLLIWDLWRQKCHRNHTSCWGKKVLFLLQRQLLEAFQLVRKFGKGFSMSVGHMPSSVGRHIKEGHLGHALFTSGVWVGYNGRDIHLWSRRLCHSALYMVLPTQLMWDLEP